MGTHQMATTDAYVHHRDTLNRSRREVMNSKTFDEKKAVE